MINAERYTRKVFYYETDKMGIVHHSNYIRMMEEARIDLLSKKRLDFAEIEKMGYLSPVVDVKCSYKYSLRFGDEFYAETYLSEFGSVRYGFRYKIFRADGVLCAEGESSHCFTDCDGNVISLKRSDKNLFERFLRLKEDMCNE